MAIRGQVDVGGGLCRGGRGRGETDVREWTPVWRRLNDPTHLHLERRGRDDRTYTHVSGDVVTCSCGVTGVREDDYLSVDRRDGNDHGGTRTYDLREGTGHGVGTVRRQR